MSSFDGLYLHIPFCARRCHYCDFNTYEGLEDLAGAYCQALQTDIQTQASAGLRGPASGLVSVYVGGGTPSLLEPGLLLGLLEKARQAWGLAPDAEVTVEVNPGTADEAKLAALRGGGFNRLSFGFQAAQDRHLEALGRIHTAAQSDLAWQQARRAGFDNVSLDLMFGLSGQTQQEWQESLDWALQRQPDHVSFYGLTVEAGTRFHQWQGQGRLPLPGEEAQAMMYETGLQALAQAGLQQYEISNFARAGRASRHNRLYWLNRPTLGLGAGAWSYVDGRRWHRLKQPQAYIQALQEGRSPSLEAEVLQGREARAEAAYLRLRLNEGLELSAWQREHGTDFMVEFGPSIQAALQGQCLAVNGDRLQLTPKGRLLSNEVFSRLL